MDNRSSAYNIKFYMYVLQATQTMDFEIAVSHESRGVEGLSPPPRCKVNGRKEELVARVFVTVENNVPILVTAEEVA